jgi:hypothetical protein
MKKNEIWIPIPDYEGLYEISNQGNIRSLDRSMTDSMGRLRKFQGRNRKILLRPNGYPFIKLSKQGEERQFSVHHLVMMAFIGQRPANWDTHHKNGISHDNRLKNLQYITKKDHAKTKRPTGRKGEFHSRAKLKEIEVRIIRQRKLKGVRAMTLAQQYRVSIHTIYDVCSGRSWPHIPLATEEE